MSDMHDAPAEVRYGPELPDAADLLELYTVYRDAHRAAMNPATSTPEAVLAAHRAETELAKAMGWACGVRRNVRILTADGWVLGYSYPHKVFCTRFAPDGMILAPGWEGGT